MKRSKFIAALAITAICISIQFMADPPLFNLIFYSFFTILMGAKIIFNIYKFHRAQKSIVLTGKVIDDIDEGIFRNSNQNITYTITFISPIDNNEYTIKSEIEYLPRNKTVDIIFNEEEPTASRTYIKSTLLENATLAFAFVGFIYLTFLSSKLV